MENQDRYERRLALKAVATQRNYRSALNKFLKITNLTQEKLIELAKADLDEVALLVSEAMRKEIKDGRKATTSLMIYKAVKFFLKSHGFKDFEVDSEDKPHGAYDGSRRTNKEQILELLDKVGAEFRDRNRAIVLFAKDSGLRISDLSRLNVEDYLNAKEIIRGEDRFKVFEPFQTLKTGEIALIHIGIESIEALEKYLSGRKSGPLFLNRAGRRLGANHISEVIGRMKRRGKLNGSFTKISAHSLRKFHYTSLKMREDYILLLEGKSTSVYLDSPEDLTEEYIKNYDNLRVYKRGASAEELKLMGTQVAKFAEENKILRDRLDHMEQFFIALTQGPPTEPLVEKIWRIRSPPNPEEEQKRKSSP